MYGRSDAEAFTQESEDAREPTPRNRRGVADEILWVVRLSLGSARFWPLSLDPIAVLSDRHLQHTRSLEPQQSLAFFERF